jgi:hypothetical protein
LRRRQPLRKTLTSGIHKVSEQHALHAEHACSLASWIPAVDAKRSASAFAKASADKSRRFAAGMTIPVRFYFITLNDIP